MRLSTHFVKLRSLFAIGSIFVICPPQIQILKAVSRCSSADLLSSLYPPCSNYGYYIYEVDESMSTSFSSWAEAGSINDKRQARVKYYSINSLSLSLSQVSDSIFLSSFKFQEYFCDPRKSIL